MFLLFLLCCRSAFPEGQADGCAAAGEDATSAATASAERCEAAGDEKPLFWHSWQLFRSEYYRDGYDAGYAICWQQTYEETYRALADCPGDSAGWTGGGDSGQDSSGTDSGA